MGTLSNFIKFVGISVSRNESCKKMYVCGRGSKTFFQKCRGYHKNFPGICLLDNFFKFKRGYRDSNFLLIGKND